MKGLVIITMSSSSNQTAKKRFISTQTLVECAIMLGLATVLSMIKILQMPLDGSVTLLSMLPITLVSIKYGLKIGLPVAFLYSLIQMAMGLPAALGWGMTVEAIIGMIFLDYILAFSVLGAAGFLRTKGVPGYIAGITAALTARFIFHFLSGIIIFAQWAVESPLNPTGDPVLHSIFYNGAYMLPELGFTLAGAILLLRAPYVRKMFSPVAGS